MSRLTSKQETFCVAYVEHAGNGSEAYRLAYDTSRMKPDSVARKASELLDNGKITARIADLRAQVAERSVVTVERTLQELSRVAFVDIRDVVTWDEDGVPHFTPSAELRPEVAAAVESVRFVKRVIPQRDGRDPIEETTQSVKLHPKLPALQLIGKHLGMFPDKVQHSGPDGGPIQLEADLRARVLQLVASMDAQTFERLLSAMGEQQ